MISFAIFLWIAEHLFIYFEQADKITLFASPLLLVYFHGSLSCIPAYIEITFLINGNIIVSKIPYNPNSVFAIQGIVAWISCVPFCLNWWTCSIRTSSCCNVQPTKLILSEVTFDLNNLSIYRRYTKYFSITYYRAMLRVLDGRTFKKLQG